MEMNDRELLEWDAQGVIPGPEEGEAQFLERAHYCLTLRERLEGALPFNGESSSEALEEALPLVEKLYGFSPRWLPLYFSNHKLSLWHGAAAWIFQITDSSPTAAFLQLRKAFYKKRSLWGLYSRDQVIAHEAAHVGRMAFEEPRFEELFACRAFTSPWRRSLGALVQSSKESALFVLLLLLLFAIDLFILAFGPLELFAQAQLFKALPLLLIAGALLRLGKRRRQLNGCIAALAAVTEKPDHFAYRLTDKEIALFSRASPEEIRAYAAKGEGLRWRLLRLAL